MRTFICSSLLFVFALSVLATAQEPLDAYEISISHKDGQFIITNISEVEAYYIPDNTIDKKIYELAKEADAAYDYYHVEYLNDVGDVLFTIPIQSPRVGAVFNDSFLVPQDDSARDFRIIDDDGAVIVEETAPETAPSPGPRTEDRDVAESSKTESEEADSGISWVWLVAIGIIVLAAIMVFQSRRN